MASEVVDLLSDSEDDIQFCVQSPIKKLASPLPSEDEYLF